MKLGSTAFALALTFGVTVTVVACGADEAEEKRQAAAKTEADEQEAFLDVYCQIILPCCNTVFSGDIDDVAGCKTRLRALDPVTIASKAARDACTEQAKRVQFPQVKFCNDFAHQVTPACPDGSRKDLVGLKKPGEVCATSKDCAPDFTGIVSCAAGVCQLRKRGADGDGPCDTTIDGDVVVASPTPAEGGTVFSCYRLDGVQCNPVTVKCQKPVAEKGKCADDGECAKTHFCVNEEDNPRQCLPRLGATQRCDTDSECKGKCEDNTCTDAIQENESCSTTRNCVDGLECVSGQCTKPGPDARLEASCK